MSPSVATSFAPRPEVRTRLRPELELHCEGLYGFGAGWVLGKEGNAGTTDGTSYCDHCPLSARCWEGHKDRLRTLLPTLMADYDTVVAEMRAAGAEPPAIIAAVTERYGADPLFAGMRSNIEDGLAVIEEGKPHYREEATIAWPFRVQ